MFSINCRGAEHLDSIALNFGRVLFSQMSTDLRQMTNLWITYGSLAQKHVELL